MFIPLAARVSNILRATPAWLRMPTPITEILATLVSDLISANLRSALAFSRRSTARARSARGTVKVMSVELPSSETFCTIMSTLMLAPASGPKIAAATPGRSATRVTVILASSLEKAMPLTTDFSNPWDMISSSSTTSVPGRSLPSAASNDDSTCTRT